MAAILRVADAFDRGHNQAVSRLEVDVGDTVVVRGITADRAHLERWAAERRAAQLSRVLRRPVRVELSLHAA